MKMDELAQTIDNQFFIHSILNYFIKKESQLFVYHPWLSTIFVIYMSNKKMTQLKI